MYRRARALSSNESVTADLRCVGATELGAVAVTSGDITGPRQASRAGSTVSHDHMCGTNAHMQ